MNPTSEAQPTDFEDSARGWAQRFAFEFPAAQKALEEWRKEAKEANDALRDERKGQPESAPRKKRNLYASNEETVAGMLYGQTPKTDVTRRFADSKDDVARIAGELLQRILNSDIEKASDPAFEAFGNARQDWRVPGCGVVRVSYVREEEETPAEPAMLKPDGTEAPGTAKPAGVRVKREEAPIDYVHHSDFLWSQARVWSEVEWVAFAAYMTRPKLVKRFGKLGELVPLASPVPRDEKEKGPNPWARAKVWEVWHRESKRVYWYVEGHDVVLDMKDDPLQLEGFFPCPKFLIANATTDALVPRPHYRLHKDRYEAINTLYHRISRLVAAVRARGVYDSSNPEVKRLLDETGDNELIPVKNFALLAEKGGLKGAVDWMPLEQLVGAIQVLSEKLREEIEALFQDTGMSDIMRGQATQGGATAHEQAIKARFGSVRIQKMQDEFARFVSEAHRLKGEIICRFFSDETILERSNAQFAYPGQEGLVRQAIALLRSQYACYRVEVKPESLSLTDFAALKQDRTELLGAVTQMLSGMAPILQMTGPQALPFLLRLMQDGVAGLRGAAQMESTLDAAIQQAEEAAQQAKANPQPQQEDPKLQTERMKQQTAMMKAQGDVQKEQAKLQGDLVRIQAETQANADKERVQREENVREAVQKQALSVVMPKPAAPSRGPGGVP